MRKNMLNGEKVRQILDDRGLTIGELAQKCNVSRPVLSQWLSGRRNPKRCSIQTIADVLRLPISEISDCQEDDYGEVLFVPQDATTATIQQNHIYHFVLSELQKLVATYNQLSAAKKLNISHSYISRLLSGKAAIEDFPLHALLLLCPQIFKSDFSGADEAPDLQQLEWLHNAIDNMTKAERSMIEQIIKTTMPRFACTEKNEGD